MAYPTPFQIWMMAIRPPTLPAAVTPVLVGTAVAVAEGTFRLLPFLAALLAAVLIQIGTNLANDYFDFKKGADTNARLGPTRVTQSGLMAPERVRAAMIACFGLAALIGLYLVFVGGLPILLIGLASIASGVLYTGGPFPLAYHGLGDLFVFVFFGLVAVIGTTYLHTGTFVLPALLAALPVGTLVTAILVVNNLRDSDTDRAAHKYTLAVIMGRPATRGWYCFLVIAAYLLLPAYIIAGFFSVWLLLAWLTLPLAVRLIRIVLEQDGRPLNRALAGTGQLHLLFGILLTIGVLIPALAG